VRLTTAEMKADPRSAKCKAEQLGHFPSFTFSYRFSVLSKLQPPLLSDILPVLPEIFYYACAADPSYSVIPLGVFHTRIYVNSNVLFDIFLLPILFKWLQHFLTNSVSGIQKFFSESLFFSLILLPNITTTENPSLLEHDAMFLGE
jgi:hypothetical protein